MLCARQPRGVRSGRTPPVDRVSLTYRDGRLSPDPLPSALLLQVLRARASEFAVGRRDRALVLVRDAPDFRQRRTPWRSETK